MKLTRTRVLAIYVFASYALAWAPAAWMAYEGHSWSGPFGRAVALFLALGLGWALFGVDPVLSTADYVAMKRTLVEPGNLPEFDRRLRESPPTSPLGLVLMALPAGLTVNLLPALGEEIAYRGLLFREIPGGYFRRSILIGFVWAGTLLPSVLGGHLYPDHRALGALLFVAYCVSLSLVLVYLRVRSGSTLAVALARGTMMGLTVVAVDLAGGASDVVRPFHGITGVLAILVVLGGLFVHDRFFAGKRLMTGDAR
jgi:membrane protease YdiL (CAAX protease family)